MEQAESRQLHFRQSCNAKTPSYVFLDHPVALFHNIMKCEGLYMPVHFQNIMFIPYQFAGTAQMLLAHLRLLRHRYPFLAEATLRLNCASDRANLVTSFCFQGPTKRVGATANHRESH